MQEELSFNCLMKLYQTTAYVLETELDVHSEKEYLREIFKQVQVDRFMFFLKLRFKDSLQL